MEVSPLRLMRLLAPRMPLILKTAILSKLSLSDNSDKQDTQTEVVVLIIRSVVGATPRPLKAIQDGSVKDLVVKGRMWIAKTAVPAPETDVRDMVLKGIKILGDGSEQFVLPDVTDISGEWTGYRDCQKSTPRMQIPEKDQFENMMKEVSSDVTVLYFHGGAYFMMDPATHRNTTSGLAKKTGGRCFSVRYRLAPQSTFPAQLIDAFIAYLYLLAPPQGAFHGSVAAKNIVFAGDSAGGNLACALLLLLITLEKAGVKTVKFHGVDVAIQAPAGIAVNSPWTDIARSLPTIYSNAKYDYLDPPSATGIPAKPLPHDEIWPSKPPRAEIFCTASLLTHPLVSPLLATPEMWEGAPPAFFCCGNEGLEDEVTVTARRMYQSGGTVYFEGYEGMPHCFAMIFPTSVAGKDCLTKWANFISDATRGELKRKQTGSWLKAFSNPASFREVDLATMGVDDNQVVSKVSRMKAMALEREQAEIQKWEREAKARL